ncbi:MAG: chromate efflux transporter, partial [Armatimonadetes bacterium]|nr:chromate efflux transporter [Anaerolineae bacterium]
NERFNRVLSVYQILPGPEAHELCVYFGYLARGRVGGLLAGLGFMLPGFVLMLLLSWFYVNYGINSVLFAGVFYGMKAAVGALIVRAVHRIGGHALHDRWLWGIAGIAALAHLAGVNFIVILALAGIAYTLFKRGYAVVGLALGAVSLVVIAVLGVNLLNTGGAALATVTTATGAVGIPGLFGAGLRSGLLTFGGAYTVISFLQNDAVIVGNWMTTAQFLDGIALSGILPAPLVIFGTFVGYIGGGLAGAVAITVGIFAPAFAFTLIGHNLIERLVGNPALHDFLDGVTGGVVGLIAATTLVLLRAAITDVPTLLIFAVGLFVLFRWKHKLNVPAVVLAAGVVGLLVVNLSA